MATDAIRAPAALAAAFTETVPLPVPDEALVTVSQLVSVLNAVHVHQSPVVIAIVAVSPPAAID